MRLLAPALAAIRSTRAPARPWAANSCFAASRMRISIPSGSSCHFKIRFALAKTGDLSLDRSARARRKTKLRGTDVARKAGFENEAAARLRKDPHAASEAPTAL